MLGLLSKIIPQSTEPTVDAAISTEAKMAFGGLFTLGFTYLLKIPAAGAIVSLTGLNVSTASSWGIVASGYISVWLIAFLHKHVYNGNAAPVVAAQMVSASPPSALKQVQGTTVASAVVEETGGATTVATTVASTPLPNPSAPAAQTSQPPAPAQASPTTPPTSSGSSQA